MSELGDRQRDHEASLAKLDECRVVARKQIEEAGGFWGVLLNPTHRWMIEDAFAGYGNNPSNRALIHGLAWDAFSAILLDYADTFEPVLVESLGNMIFTRQRAYEVRP